MGKHNLDAQSRNQPRRHTGFSDKSSSQEYSSESSRVSDSVGLPARPPPPSHGFGRDAPLYYPSPSYHPYPVPPLHLRPRNMVPNSLVSDTPGYAAPPPPSGLKYHPSDPLPHPLPWNSISNSPSSPSASPSHRRVPQSFRPGTPTKEYNQTATRDSKRSDAPHPMLLVLDLNGTLLHRKRQGAHFRITPRPNLEPFLEWAFRCSNKLNVMIWSSAQPENVELMARKCFGRHYDSIYEIWARDTLGLTKAEYHQKVQTVKNLDVVWQELTHFSAEDTILLDDSALKAHMQPYNHLIVHEYERSNAPELDCDETLLAVVGILSEATRQTNVASWFRSGGLLSPPPSNGDPAISQEQEDAAISEVWNGLALRSCDVDTSLETMWFDRPVIFNRWVEIGSRELEAHEILIAARPADQPVNTGIMTSPRLPVDGAQPLLDPVLRQPS